MSDIKGIREISNDPFGRFLTSLSKKFSAFLAKDQADNVENPEDIYSDGQDVESALKYHNFVMQKEFNLTKLYYTASEPDYNNVKVYLGVPFPTLGQQMTDKSGFDNHANILGDPMLIDGTPFDGGIVDSISNTKSVALRFNRPTSDLVNQEAMTITDDTDIDLASASTGFSIFLRFRLNSLAPQGTQSATLFQKVDDSTPNNGFILKVESTGKIFAHVVKGGTATLKETATGTIVVNTVYDLWMTFTVSGNVTHVYVNNVDKTLSTSADTPNYYISSQDMQIFRRGNAGYCYGDFYHMVIMKDKIVNSTDVGRHFTNKWTIANIPFSQVNITNYGSTS